MATIQHERPFGLNIVTGLLAGFDAEGIRYCHWKSNKNIGRGLQGRTDLDILVERSSDQRLGHLLSRLGYKRFSAPCWRRYPSIESYLAMDRETGELVHLHLHYQLRLGEKHLKGYRVPWEHLVLTERRLDSESGVYVCDPSIELILLVVRAALKMLFRDRLLQGFGVQYLRGEMLDEFHWLMERTQVDRVVEIGRSLMGEESSRQLRAILDGQASLSRLRAFRRSIRPTLRLHRAFSPLGARLRRWARELCGISCTISRRYFHSHRACTRTRPVGGLIVAFIGADGSGKSTMVKETVAWLSSNVDVVPVYFGSGDGPTSLLRLPLRVAYRLHKRLVNRADPGERRGSSRTGRPAELFRILSALVIARERGTNLREAWRARNQGLLVIADRYPQNQVMGLNDGPRLSRWLDDHRALLRSMARWEFSRYEEAARSPPDLAIRLRVRPEVAFDRKRDMSIDEIRRRIEVVEGLRYPARTEIVEIDANSPLQEVLRQVRRVIWKSL